METHTSEFPADRGYSRRATLYSTFALLFLTAALFSLTAGCASPGEPIERKAPIPEPVKDLAASQSGNDVVLTFTLPTEALDHRQLEQTPAVEIYRAFVTTTAPGAT